MSQTLYKYRSLRSDFSYKFLIDLLLHKRIYAARFDELNDPMEGTFSYLKVVDDKSLLEEIRAIKEGYGICSFSKEKNIPLMWSHYADGCRGFIVGVSLSSNEPYQGDVQYKNSVSELDSGRKRCPHERVRDILNRKLSYWTDEEEYRVLARGRNYISVKIEKLILGWKMTEPEKNFLIESFKKAGLSDDNIVSQGQYEF